MGLDIKEIPLETLYISPHNARRDPGDLTELITSITDIGVLEPILVRQNGELYEVIAGSRRAQAARSAGQQTIPAVVLVGTDSKMIFTSLIENIQRKDLTLAERVETYQALQRIDSAYYSHHNLAKATGLSHQKVSQDFQAYEMHRRLQPFGITVASDLPLSAAERQQGKVLPEYHAVLLHQALPYVAEEELLALARRLACLSQAAAKAYVEAVKRRRETQKSSAKQQDDGASGGTDGGVATCEYCERQLSLVHYSDNTHQVKPYSPHLKDQMELPGLFP